MTSLVDTITSLASSSGISESYRMSPAVTTAQYPTILTSPLESITASTLPLYTSSGVTITSVVETQILSSIADSAVTLSSEALSISPVYNRSSHKFLSAYFLTTYARSYHCGLTCTPLPTSFNISSMELTSTYVTPESNRNIGYNGFCQISNAFTEHNLQGVFFVPVFEIFIPNCLRFRFIVNHFR